MKKLIISFLTVFTLLTINTYAANYANIPVCSVRLSGQSVDNHYRQYPLLQYRDIVYFPMTYHDCRFLGVSTDWNGNTNTLTITKENISGAYRNYNWEWKNSKSNKIDICKFNIIVNGKVIDNSKEKYPLITFRDVTYFPLTWRFAVDEFGWEYSYDDKNGLVIDADNYICETLALPDVREIILPSAATDGKYYYYTGNNKKVYRTPVNDTSKNELILTTPAHGYTQTGDNPISFTEENGSIYMAFRTGGVMGTNYRYRINADGTVTETDEGTYNSSGAGYNKKTTLCDGYTMTVINAGHPESTQIFYTKDGIEKEITLDGVQLGEKRAEDPSYGISYVNTSAVGQKIYLMGYKKGTSSPHKIYCFDIDSETISPVIEDAENFIAFKGWDTAKNCDSDMIVYYKGGKLIRYSSASGENVVIKENSLPLITGVCLDSGLYLYTETEERAFVLFYDGYGIGSVQGKVLLDTTLGTDATIIDGMLCTQSYFDKEGENIKTCVFNRPDGFFRSSDSSDSLFIYDGTVIYTLWNSNDIIKVNLERGR